MQRWTHVVFGGRLVFINRSISDWLLTTITFFSEQSFLADKNVIVKQMNVNMQRMLTPAILKQPKQYQMRCSNEICDIIL